MEVEQGELATQQTQQDEPQDLRSALEKAYDGPAEQPGNITDADDVAEQKVDRARDEAGRFKKAEATDAPPQEVKPEAETPAAPVSEKRPPSSWKKEAAAEFDKLPVHVQDEILRREGDFHKGIEGFKTHAELGRSMERALQPYMQTIQSLGVAPDVAVGHLLRADAMLRNGSQEQKATYLATLAKQYGIDMGQASQVAPEQQYVFQLEQQLKQLQQQQQDFQRSQQEREMQSLNSELQAFSQEHEHFEAVRDDMAALLQAGRAKDLQEAYDMAVYANPQTRAALLEQQRQEALKQAQSQALASRAKAAAVSVRGSSPASGSVAAPTSLRAALEAAYTG